MSTTSSEVYRLDALYARAPDVWFEVEHYEHDVGLRFARIEPIDQDVIVLTECGAARVALGYSLAWSTWHHRIDWQLIDVGRDVIRYETQDGSEASIDVLTGHLSYPHDNSMPRNH